jgi:hypothetical protein
MDTITIRLANDAQQLADIQAIKASAHNMAGAALDLAKNGSQGYDQFINIKQDFEHTVDSFFKHYKHCEIIRVE